MRAGEGGTRELGGQRRQVAGCRGAGEQDGGHLLACLTMTPDRLCASPPPPPPPHTHPSLVAGRVFHNLPHPPTPWPLPPPTPPPLASDSH